MMKRILVVLAALLLPCPGILANPPDRPVEIDANGTLLVGSVSPTTGYPDRSSSEIDANGIPGVSSVSPTTGYPDRSSSEIDPNGIPGVSSVSPTTGYPDGQVVITDTGVFTVISEIPALGWAGMATLLLLMLMTGAWMQSRRRRARAEAG